MKRFCYLLVLICTISFTACDDFFDIKPTDIINEDDLWSDPNLILNAVTELYAKSQYEDFGYFEGFWVFSQLSPTCASDDAYPCWQAGDFGTKDAAQVVYGDEWFYHWPYDQIRNCNVFLQRILDAPLSNEDKSSYAAEVRFLRAFHYFHLAKRYGGVPLVTEPQEYDPANLESLQLPRAKEQEIWDFINTELEEASKGLPETRDSRMKNRANKYTALALKSRAMLYAASIAEYGKVDKDGAVGIAADAKSYWEDAYKAADDIIASQRYSLFKKYDDKSENYQQLFLEKDNGEYIWAKEYILPSVAHDFDKYATPYSFVGGYGCGMAPTLEFVEAYEYIDGRPGTLVVTENGAPKEYDHPLDLFAGKDPRLAATVYLPMSPCRGDIMETRRGMYKKTTGEFIKAPNRYDTGTLADGREIILSGKDGIIDSDDVTKSGFYQKKFLNEKLTNIDFGQSDQSWPVFRLAEMYLNKAEAAFMLGKTSDALEAINQVRERAGIKLLTAGELTLDKIRNERRIELSFENHRFWDLRRWRIAATSGLQKGILDDWEPTALYPYIVYENGKYIFTKANSSEVPKPRKVFYERHYYIKFKAEDMTSNRLLVQNPGY